jgi:hypothetical protein
MQGKHSEALFWKQNLAPDNYQGLSDPFCIHIFEVKAF